MVAVAPVISAAGHVMVIVDTCSVVPSERTTTPAGVNAGALHNAEAVFVPTQPSATTVASVNRTFWNRFILESPSFFRKVCLKILLWFEAPPWAAPPRLHVLNLKSHRARRRLLFFVCFRGLACHPLPDAGTPGALGGTTLLRLDGRPSEQR